MQIGGTFPKQYSFSKENVCVCVKVCTRDGKCVEFFFDIG